MTEPVHAVKKGDPRVNGPYLDDIRADEERAYREARNDGATITREDSVRQRDNLDRAARTELLTDTTDENAVTQNHHAVSVEDTHDQKAIHNRTIDNAKSPRRKNVEEPELELAADQPEEETTAEVESENEKNPSEVEDGEVKTEQVENE